MTSLFKPTRACICCERTATPRNRKPGEPNILAISMAVYYKGHGKRTLSGVPGIRICSDCLAKALAEPKLWNSQEARKFVAAIRGRLSASYSAILDADVLDQVKRPRFDGSGNLLDGIE